MKDPIITCDICHADMDPIKYTTIGYTVNGARKRMFKCTVCDYKKLVYANGVMQNIIEQINAEKDSKKASEPIKIK